MLGLGEFTRAAGQEENVDSSGQSTYRISLVVGRHVRTGVTGELPSWVGFSEYHKRGNQVYETVASEC